MVGRDGYRLRIGDYRALFDIIDNEIVVHEIGSRGQIIKGGVDMSELRKEVLDCIDHIPDSKLEALRPILRLLTDDAPRI